MHIFCIHLFIFCIHFEYLCVIVVHKLTSNTKYNPILYKYVNLEDRLGNLE